MYVTAFSSKLYTLNSQLILLKSSYTILASLGRSDMWFFFLIIVSIMKLDSENI